MSGGGTFSSVGAAFRAIQRDLKARERRLGAAVQKTARQTRNFAIRETIPRAFGELADSTHVVDALNGSAVVTDAPHAAAVENGSRPHTPPLAPLIRWVQLRGIQGLTSKGAVKSNRGRYGNIKNPNREPARVIATSLRAALKSRKAASAWRAAAVAVTKGLASYPGGADPATVKIARAIQRKIARSGTRPHKFMLQAVPAAETFLAGFVAAALPDP